MIHLPTEIHGPIAGINGTPWFFGRWTPYTYSSLSIKEQKAHLYRGASFFQTGMTDDHITYVWMVRKQQDWSREMDREVRKGPKQHRDALRETTNAWIEKIEEEGGQSQYEYIVAGELPRKFKGFQGLERIISRYTPLRIPSFMTETLTERKVIHYLSTFQKKVSQFNIKPLTELEIMKFYLDHNHCGLPFPDLKKLFKDQQAWGKRDFAFLQPNVVTPVTMNGDYGPHVRITSSRGVKYVAFLTIALLPIRGSLPGMDLFHDLQCTGLPVEALARVLYRGPASAKKFASGKRKTAKSNAEHAGEVGDDSVNDFDPITDANMQEREVHRRNLGINYTHFLFKLTADTPAELDNYCELLEQWLENNKGIKADRFAADQGEYYDCWMPSPYWSAKGYRHELLPNRTAALVTPGATDALGDPSGLPVGFLESNRAVVRIDMPRGAEIDQASNILIVGPVGAGKTHLGRKIIRNTKLTSPVRVLIADQKNEYRNWNQIEEDSQIYTVDGYRNPGIFDPFHMTQRVDEESIGELTPEQYRIQLARDLGYRLIECIQDTDGDSNRFKWENAVNEAMDRVIAKGNPSMVAVIDELQKHEDPSTIDFARSLKRKAETSLGKLIFGHPKEGKKIQFPETGTIILSINTKLDLPQKGYKATNDHQRMSEAVMAGFNAYCEQFLLEGKEQGIFSILFEDDASHFNSNDTGAMISDRIFRLGRSKFCGVILATQNPTDIPDNLLNNCGMYICMGARSHDEILRAMQDLGVDHDNEEVYQTLKQLGIEQSEKNQDEDTEREFSRGYVRDLSQRVGLVRFITPEEDLRRIYKTRQERSQYQEAKRDWEEEHEPVIV